MKKLDRNFYARDTIQVAKDLLGKYIVHETQYYKLIGKIVEDEAYLGPEDKAAHSYQGHRSQRNDVMYGPAGYAYVFVIYGRNCCMNVVTESESIPQAVLIRALEPIYDINKMALFRYGIDTDNIMKLDKQSVKYLTNGPGKLCRALNIDRSSNGKDLCNSSIYIMENEEEAPFETIASKRVNIEYAEEYKHKLWRFYIKDNKFISKK